MFTGIIEALGKVEEIVIEGSNTSFYISAPFYKEVKIDQSIAHNGVCLTVDELQNDKSWYRVTAIDETLQKTNLGKLNIGGVVNLERCMQMGGRLDGHIVQGHVDQVATVAGIEEQDGSWLFHFQFEQGSHVMVEKGSVTVNGTSLTCFNVEDGKFSVAIIPYTYEHTVFYTLKSGDKVNLEFDIIGKYVERLMQRS